jgi:membrane-bound lytic murein transglycosylase B
LTKQRTETQRKAERWYRERQKGKPRLPGGIYLDEQHAHALERIAQHYGSKSAAILAAIINEAERMDL